MESGRVAKRRKLDTPERGYSKSSPIQRREKTSETPKERAFANAGVRSAINGSASNAGAHESWKQARTQAQDRRGKRTVSGSQSTGAVDVYDDIEGAHSGRSKLKPLANSAPETKQLDPLRNQASSTPAASSPAKARTGLDFFKRFTKPRDQDETPKKTDEHLLNCAAQSTPSDIRAGEQQDEQMQDADRSTPATHSGKGAWKSWAYAEKAKKTFEDEINDLVHTAREKAENEDEEGATDRTSLRRRFRQSATPIVAPPKDDAPPKTKFAPVITPRTMKTAGRPRQPSMKQAASKKVDKGVQDDKMDIDDVENVGNELERQLQAEIGSQPPATTPLKQKLQQPAKKAAQQSIPDITFEAEALKVIQSVVLQKLTSKRPTPLANVDDEHAKVSNVITQAVTAGESNSMLLIGSRGSGKTTLIDQALLAQAIEHPDDFHVVRLNGFIHTDDKIALREIWRQLGREMELDEEESNLKNYADTLTSLLALLSHPAEQGREQAQGQITKSVIFILDEFELFASHPRQTLLYNLFDIAQSRKAPITVLGLTTKIDVAESLEKRVKSRFSHRYVHLSSSKSLTAFQDACKAALGVHQDDLRDDEKAVLGNASLKAASKSAGSIIEQWSSFVDTLFLQEEMTAHLRHIYYTTKSIPEFHASMLLPTSSLPTDSATSASELITHLTPSPFLSAPDSKLSLLSGLSTLHLALLICAARLTAIHAQDTIPFAQAYEEYKSIASKAKIQASASGALAQGAGARIWGKDVAKDVWGELVGMGLVMEDGVRGGRVDVGLEEIGISGVELGSWGRWCREI